ncbi:MAG: membrane protein insertion efficiency factor YidD [Opitutaceae bacterium]|nr:membrane protein insertion efficiency factor YidD [Opitutaceae bacterium]
MVKDRSTRPIAWVAIKLIRIYQLFLSPIKYVLFGPNSGCRYQPTCSQYAIECFREMPSRKALFYSLRRILRCHPWGGSGYDPVPREARSENIDRNKPAI